MPPPSAAELVGTLEQHGLHGKLYQRPYYSNPDDAPEFVREYAGLVFDLRGEYDVHGMGEDPVTIDVFQQQSVDSTFGITGWEFAGTPPTLNKTRRWLEETKNVAAMNSQETSQVIQSFRLFLMTLIAIRLRN